MSSPSDSLVEALCAVLGPRVDEPTRRAVERFSARATSGQPELVNAAHACAALLRRGIDGVPPEQWPARIERLVAPDLLLAAGLSVGDRSALEEFEERFVPVISAVLRRMRLSSDDAAEMTQGVRVHLLVATEHRRPRIERYGGRGSLEGWIRTTTLRYALGEVKSQDLGDGASRLEHLGVSPLTEPPARRVDRHRQLRSAVSDAFAELPPRDRRLLRGRYVEGKVAVVLAEEHGVHESTMSRWLARARADFEARVQDRARALMGTSSNGRLLETLMENLEDSLRGLFDTRSE